MCQQHQREHPSCLAELCLRHQSTALATTLMAAQAPDGGSGSGWFDIGSIAERARSSVVAVLDQIDETAGAGAAHDEAEADADAAQPRATDDECRRLRRLLAEQQTAAAMTERRLREQVSTLDEQVEALLAAKQASDRMLRQRVPTAAATASEEAVAGDLLEEVARLKGENGRATRRLKQVVAKAKEHAQTIASMKASEAELRTKASAAGAQVSSLEAELSSARAAVTAAKEAAEGSAAERESALEAQVSSLEAELLSARAAKEAAEGSAAEPDRKSVV